MLRLYTWLATMTVIITGLVQGQFDTRPENIAVVKEKRVVLQCTATGAGSDKAQQNWYEYYTDPNTLELVAQNNGVRPDYLSEFNIQGVFNLMLNQSQLKHGGKYGCSDAFAALVPFSYAELIVLDSDPVLTSSGLDQNIVLEGNSVKYTCEVTFQGRWRPVMEWTDKDNNKIPHNDESTSGLTKTNIMFDAKGEDNGQQYKCNTKFGPLTPAPGTDEAVNIPGYTYINPSKTLIVHYGPRNTQMKDPNGDVITDGQQLYLGETITCSSTSNPPIDSYQWINATDNSTLGSASSITVDPSWIGENKISCRVGNTMGANSNINEYESTEVFTFTVYMYTTKSTTTTPFVGGLSTSQDEIGNNTGAIIGGTVGCFVIIAAVIVVVIIVILRGQRNTKSPDEVKESKDEGVVINEGMYQNVRDSQLKIYVGLQPDTKEEDANPYNNDYMELKK